MRKLSAMVLAFALASPGVAYAQSSSGSNPQAGQQQAQQQAQQQTKPTAASIKSSLEKQGFKNVRVTPEAFIVRAETSDGHPILMTMDPLGVSAIENFSSQGSGSGSTGASKAPSSKK